MMGPGFPTRIAAAATLGAVCIGLAIIISFELRGRPDAVGAVPSRTSPPPTGRVHEPARFVMRPLQSFGAITARPLFSSSRRPVHTSSSSMEPSSSLVLAGIIITPQAREALIRHGDPEVTSDVKAGQQIQGWTVVSILPNGVILRSGTTENKLKLPPKAAGGVMPAVHPSRRRH